MTEQQGGICRYLNKRKVMLTLFQHPTAQVSIMLFAPHFTGETGGYLWVFSRFVFVLIHASCVFQNRWVFVGTFNIYFRYTSPSTSLHKYSKISRIYNISRHFIVQNNSLCQSWSAK